LHRLGHGSVPTSDVNDEFRLSGGTRDLLGQRQISSLLEWRIQYSAFHRTGDAS
jgi:hypothetical protein